MQSWAVWIPSVITLLSVIYGAGAIVGRIKDQEITLEKHENRIGGAELRLGINEIAIAKGEAWRAGYDAGKSSHGRM